MKTAKVLYWVTTILLALFILPGLFFMDSELAKEGMAHVQAPLRLGQLAGWGQPLAILLILIPGAWKRLKEWAYVGLGLVYIGAFYAHLTIDGVANMNTIMALGLFAVLLVSYVCWHKISD